jgi:hypothetical protein
LLFGDVSGLRKRPRPHSSRLCYQRALQRSFGEGSICTELFTAAFVFKKGTFGAKDVAKVARVDFAQTVHIEPFPYPGEANLRPCIGWFTVLSINLTGEHTGQVQTRGAQGIMKASAASYICVAAWGGPGRTGKKCTHKHTMHIVAVYCQGPGA